jgi:HEPN domain-containing protein
MPAKTPTTLDELLRDVLPTLDSGYAEEGLSIRDRPFAAARFIVQHLIIRIEGDTKDEFYLKPWFAALYQEVYDWFERRYGTALTTSGLAQTQGVVEYFGSALLFRLPLVFTSAGEKGTSWIHFPKAALPQEGVLDWLVHGPQLKTLPQRRAVKLEASIRKTATELRTINANLNTAKLEDKKVRSLVATVIRHLEKAATDAVATDDSARCLAVWELQMACEKTMKGYLSQQLGHYPETHNLRELRKRVSASPEASAATRHISAFPSDSRVIAWRYSEAEPPKPAELLRFYAAAIQICLIFSEAMQRDLVFVDDFAIQIKAPPWRGGA